MAKTIHVHLPALLKKPVKARDATSMTFRQALEDPEGRKLINQIEEYISDLRRYDWKHPDHERGLKWAIAELKRKTGYNYTYTKDASASEWAEFRREAWEKLEVGKTYKINGRSGTVMKKSENPGSGNRTGGGNPMALIKWKDAREQRFGLPVYTEEEIKQKIRNGEWEAETDIAKGKRVELRNGSKRFQVYVKDAESPQGMSQRRQRLIAALKKHGFSEAAATVEAKQYMSIPDMAKLERGLTEKGYSLDAGFTTYDPREAKRLDDEIKEVEGKIKATTRPFEKKDLEQVLEKLRRERAKYRS